MNKEQGKSNDSFDESISFGKHLSDEDLIAYQYGTMPSPEVEQRAQDHLIECRRCTNLLLELSEFAASTAMPKAAENTDAQWAQFQIKRANDEKPAANKPEKVPFWKSIFSFPAFNAATAAAFGVLVIFLGGFVYLTFFRAARTGEINQAAVVTRTPPRLTNEFPTPEKTTVGESRNNSANTVAEVNPNRRITKRGEQNSNAAPLKPLTVTKDKSSGEPPPTPRPKVEQKPRFENEMALNTIDVALYPNEVVRGGAADRRVVRIKSNAVEQIRLKLNAPKSENSAGFSVEIADSQNNPILTLPILPDKRGDFYLTIPVKKLPAAVYTLKIYAEINKVRRVFSEYEFALEYE